MWAVCSVTVSCTQTVRHGIPDVNICALSGLIQALRGPLPAGLLSVQSASAQPAGFHFSRSVQP